jgi:hypothetical protein
MPPTRARGDEMNHRAILAYCVTAILCRAAVADDVYTIHENVHVGDKTTYSLIQEIKVKKTSTSNGVATPTDTQVGENWKLTMTALAVKDGSALRAQADLDPSSYDTIGAAKLIRPCPYVGAHVFLSLHADGNITSDFVGNASDDDIDLMTSALTPDEDLFPDKPVAVGDTWDATAKTARHWNLGPDDKSSCQCRLDWVKIIGGKQIAQISSSMGLIQHEAGNVEEDSGWSSTCLVDIAAGMIIKCDASGTSKFITPASEPTQVTGGTEFSFHSEVLAPTPPTPTTKP